jgi:hypothetical protein
MLVQHRVVTEFRSWQERAKAANGESAKYVSQGWKSTVDASAPSYGEDYVNLGAVDKCYAAIENDPFAEGEIILKMVIQGTWYRLVFDFDNKWFTEGKVALPVIKVEDGQPVFIFTVVTDNPVVQFSGDYVIGVDVGINNYATVVVREVETGRVVVGRVPLRPWVGVSFCAPLFAACWVLVWGCAPANGVAAIFTR